MTSKHSDAGVLPASTFVLPGRTVDIEVYDIDADLHHLRRGIVIDVNLAGDATVHLPDTGEIFVEASGRLRPVNPDRPKLAYDDLFVAALAEKLAERAGPDTLARFYRGYNEGRTAYTEIARTMLTEIDTRAFGVKHSRCSYRYIETPIREGAPISPLPGDVWCDTALRSDVHADGVHWHARLDDAGDVELHEPGGPGLVTASNVKKIRGGFKLLSRESDEPLVGHEPVMTWQRRESPTDYEPGDRLVECSFYVDGPGAFYCGVHRPIVDAGDRGCISHAGTTEAEYDEARARGELVRRAPVTLPVEGRTPLALTEEEQRQQQLCRMIDVAREVLTDAAQQHHAEHPDGPAWPGMTNRDLRTGVKAWYDARALLGSPAPSLVVSWWDALSRGLRTGRIILHPGARYSPAPDYRAHTAEVA